MKNEINVSMAALLLISFLVLQVLFSFFSEDTLFNSFGGLQLFFLLSFVICFSLGQNRSLNRTFAIVIFYQIILVFTFYIFFIEVYHNPLFHPDAVLYDELGRELAQKSFEDSIAFLSSSYSIADFGFPILLKIVYSVGGSEIFNMKLANILFHLLTCYGLFNLSKYFLSPKKSLLLLLLFGLNPFSIYFNTSGLKETFFALIVTYTFLFFYKSNFTKKRRYFLLGVFFLLASTTFRIFMPIFLLVPVVLMKYIYYTGRNKAFFKGVLLFAGLLLLGSITVLLGDDLKSVLAIDPEKLASHRLGRAPALADYPLIFLGSALGPFPSFQFNSGNDIGLLESVGSFVKIFFSFFFVLGLYDILSKRIKQFYPLILFIALNLLLLTVIAAGLDPRFTYILLPFYFLIVVHGYTTIEEKKSFVVRFSPYYFFILALIVAFNFR